MTEEWGQRNGDRGIGSRFSKTAHSFVLNSFVFLGFLLFLSPAAAQNKKFSDYPA